MAEFRSFPAFKHALATTFGNLLPAIRMTWPWMALIAVAQILNMSALPGTQQSTDLEISKLAMPVAVILGSLILILCTLGVASIAVSLHRYILLGEEARGLYKARIDRLVWRYLGNLVLVQLGVVCSALVAFIVLWLAYAALGLVLPQWLAVGLVWIAGAAGFLWLGQAFLRISTKLPAVALGREDYGFRRAWEDSRGNGWGVFGFWFVLLLFSFAVLALLFLPLTGVYWRLGPGSLPVTLIFYGVQFVANWFMMILGVIMLTTQYRIVAEELEA